MVDSHNYSFFGENIGLIVRSSSRSEPFASFRLVKKKGDGSWEKLSSSEGKSVKLSLEEIASILKVLKGKTNEWTAYHSYEGTKTQILVNREDDARARLKIRIADRSKPLNDAQVDVLKLLLKHLLKEKIENATIPRSNSVNGTKDQGETGIEAEPCIEPSIIEKSSLSKIIKSTNSIEKPGDIIEVQGTIEGETEKALLIQFDLGKKAWIPRSKIQSSFDNTSDSKQSFSIEKWILKKNQIVN